MEVTFCPVLLSGGERRRHDKAMEAQMEWAKKRQERLNYINNEIMKEHKAEKGLQI